MAEDIPSNQNNVNIKIEPCSKCEEFKKLDKRSHLLVTSDQLKKLAEFLKDCELRNLAPTYISLLNELSEVVRSKFD